MLWLVLVLLVTWHVQHAEAWHGARSYNRHQFGGFSPHQQGRQPFFDHRRTPLNVDRPREWRPLRMSIMQEEQKEPSRRRMSAARSFRRERVRRVRMAGINDGFMIYGHEESNSCKSCQNPPKPSDRFRRAEIRLNHNFYIRRNKKAWGDDQLHEADYYGHHDDPQAPFAMEEHEQTNIEQMVPDDEEHLYDGVPVDPFYAELYFAESEELGAAEEEKQEQIDDVQEDLASHAAEEEEENAQEEEEVNAEGE